eukprot:CAMPEP_0172297248 /NCGR_PEP_ID=MMETSP1058-20130122/344_1 /TAXON_ID=83371 /ORGANISM="Detonula confervacea, Strain CCMP 353" /LENGTH=132 /DNA_ID=CAMNT_0013006377 /DNA_START=69 /DNA_END=467 /DNA_ORIENTATION=+
MNSNLVQLLSVVGITFVGLLASSSSTEAFSPIIAAAHTTRCSSNTALSSITFEPPPEENCELDSSDCEESIFDRKKRERGEADQSIKDRYRTEHGIELNDADLVETVDQYQNVQLGGGLIPGMTLTSMCGDD